MSRLILRISRLEMMVTATDQLKALKEARAFKPDMANECRRILEGYHVQFRQSYEIVGALLATDCTAVRMRQITSIDH